MESERMEIKSENGGAAAALTPERLEELRRLASASTEGPFMVRRTDSASPGVKHFWTIHAKRQGWYPVVGNAFLEADADLIAATLNAIDVLLSSVEENRRLRERVAFLEKALGQSVEITDLQVKGGFFGYGDAGWDNEENGPELAAYMRENTKEGGQ